MDAGMKHDHSEVKMTTLVALSNGQVVQTPDGRAAVYNGLRAAEANDYVTLFTGGVRDVTKSTSVAFLPGQEVWWDIANNRATYRLAALATASFYVGLAIEGATAAATTIKVAMNQQPAYLIDTNVMNGEWAANGTLGLGVTRSVMGEITLAFDAVAEVAQAELYSTRNVDVDDKPIWEAEVAIYNIGDAAALDIDLGMASATHASDFDAIAAFVAFHLDGNSLNINAHSDDATTDVAAVDTTIDAVDDTYLFLQIDARDKSDVQLYINGANVLPATTFTLAAHTSTLKAIALIEKTSDDTVADVRIRRMTVRTAAAA